MNFGVCIAICSVGLYLFVIYPVHRGWCYRLKRRHLARQKPSRRHCQYDNYNRTNSPDSNFFEREATRSLGSLNRICSAYPVQTTQRPGCALLACTNIGGGRRFGMGGGKTRGALGDGSPPAGSRGGAPVGGLGDEVPRS